ncbi:MAG: hypothetical protein OET44_03100 [Gammaproteobacteria bacterium]|nr:hypothetical protein [Gammaproteobacteria bacterium]
MNRNSTERQVSLSLPGNAPGSGEIRALRCGHRMRGLIARVLAGIVVTAAASCSQITPKEIRTWTYPPDFNYISSGELSSIMSQMASEIAALDSLLRSTGAPDEITRQEVVQRLRALNRAAQQLGPGGWPSNHPRIADNAGRFQRDIALALRAAQRQPPQYFLAGSLSGSCSICHGAR